MYRRRRQTCPIGPSRSYIHLEIMSHVRNGSDGKAVVVITVNIGEGRPVISASIGCSSKIDCSETRLPGRPRVIWARQHKACRETPTRHRGSVGGELSLRIPQTLGTFGSGAPPLPESG